MSSDNRFMYSQPQPQAIATNYDYSSYPPPTHAAAPYENGQIHPSQQRPPLRSTSSSQPHSPTQPTHFHQPQPQPTYSIQSQTYAPAPYVSQSQSQWSAQGWSYSPVYPPQQPPPPSEPSYKSEPQYNGSPTSRMDTRMDTRPSPPPEQRGYAPPPNPNPPRVAEDRPPPPPHHAHHSSHPPPPHQPAHQPSHQPSHQPTHQSPHQHSQQQQQHQPPPPQHHLSHPPPPPHQQQVNHQHTHQPHHQPPVHASQPPPNHVGPPPKRLREMESPPMASAPMPPPPITPVGPPPHSLDFMKLVESYQVIIHTGDSLSRSSAPGRPFPLDAIDKMLQSATYGVQIFESTSSLPASPALSEVRPPSEEQPPPEPQQPPQVQEPTTNGTAPAAKKQKTEEPSQDGQTCLGCKATSTPEWRRGPMGPRTLCNACGLVYAKMIKKRTRESLRANGKTNGQNGAGFNGNGGDDGASNGEDDSDAESYGSQDHKDA